MSNIEKKESTAVQAHIAMLQGIISRMASNSANCKTWAVTIIAAMLVLIVDKDLGFTNIGICYIPVALFFFLDCYYLGLERTFIKKQNSFLDKVLSGDYVDELYVIKDLPKYCGQLGNTFKAMLSFSTTPFYGLIAVFIFILGRYFNG
ncbi:MAG: hypothetical protein EZS26_002514 [Candidatus Ordinivivax streblomastigis]|jgi:hypothetical protein|uniref:Uncharacterized protein n=1 Tax=Candidatus Ordinivivax streblomastigis TaxID=2540710 RepID=A0A5M8NXH9_9BACT|nr:MAG: hypothetical protein EZS26_002514 [Candidatus Ordinivivax streblomastigis]